MPEAAAVKIPMADAKPRAAAGPRLKVWRRISQLAMLAVIGQWSFYGIFRCPFVVPFVSCQNCPVITCYGRLFTMFWGFWLAMPVLAVLFGRAFCGWLCPGGLVNQLIGKLSFAKIKINPRVAVAGLFIALAVSLYAWLAAGQPRLAIPIRVGDFFNSVRLTFEHADMLWLVRTFVVLGFLALGLVAANAWCRLACPTGGALEIVKRISLFKVYKTDACNDCNKCLRVCEMQTRPAEANCTNCTDCLDSCPVGAIKVGRPGREG